MAWHEKITHKMAATNQTVYPKAVEMCSCSYIAGSVVRVHAIYIIRMAPT